MRSARSAPLPCASGTPPAGSPLAVSAVLTDPRLGPSPHSWNAADVNPDVEVVIGVPAPYMEFVRGEMRKEFEVASQNVLDKASGYGNFAVYYYYACMHCLYPCLLGAD